MQELFKERNNKRDTENIACQLFHLSSHLTTYHPFIAPPLKALMAAWFTSSDW